MNRQLLLGAALLVMTQNSILGQQGKDSILAEHYKTRRFDVAIFPKTLPENLDAYYFSANNRFTPTKMDVDMVERQLPKELKKYESDPKVLFIRKNLTRYRRQYIGYIETYTGHKILIINSFLVRENEDRHWLGGIIAAFGGGLGYWNIKYDLNTHEFSNFSYNAEM